MGDVVERIWMVARSGLECSAFVDNNEFGGGEGCICVIICLFSGGEIALWTSGRQDSMDFFAT